MGFLNGDLYNRDGYLLSSLNMTTTVQELLLLKYRTNPVMLGQNKLLQRMVPAAMSYPGQQYFQENVGEFILLLIL
jgi:hypothetical protein